MLWIALRDAKKEEEYKC